MNYYDHFCFQCNKEMRFDFAYRGTGKVECIKCGNEIICQTCDELKLQFDICNNNRLSESLAWSAYDKLQEHLKTHQVLIQ